MNELMENFEAFGKNYLNRLTELLGEMDLTQIDLLMNLCNQARLKGNTIFFAGNGGSAATASHYACDFLGANVKRKLDPPYRAHSICDNNAVLTAFGNDFGYDNIFVEQLTTLYRKGDLLVISASQLP